MKMKECCRSYMEAEFGGDQDVIAEIYAEYAKSVKEKASARYTWSKT